MASHQLAIAKASFSAGLLRPDPTSLAREDIALFHSLLNTVVLQCSPINVQKCKQWILDNIAQSAARFTALGKYLTSLTASYTEPGASTDAKKREPSVKRRRLHVLYLVNDILFHSKYRINDASICGKMQPILVSLFGSTASFQGCPKHQRKIAELLEIWEEKGYYSKEYIEKLREAVKNAAEVGEHAEGSNGDKEQGITTKGSKFTPYVMPAMHGDVSTPWFDLPAGNLLPHIVPNSTRPMNPDMIKPLQFVAGPAEEGLTLAVKALLDDVQAMFGGETDLDEIPTLDFDDLGQPIIVDENTGDVIRGEGYYGWSRTFCEKMRRRKMGLDVPSRDEGRDERSQSLSLSPNIRKRRYSRSDSDSDRADYRSTRRRRSYSSSSSRTPDGKRNGQSRSRSGRRSSLSPEPKIKSGQEAVQRPQPPPPPPPPPHDDVPPQRPMPPMPQPPYQQGFNPNFPPPPPPIHNMPFNGQQQYGQWPPPPPPMPFNFPQQPVGSWPIPPPPPGPPPGNPPLNYHQQGNYQQPNFQQGGYQQQQQQQYLPSDGTPTHVEDEEDAGGRDV
ncbi:uncharacterized protein L3040_002811 [Drepanopeziza brunnea f. sp. 'multigermtubi']|uniref:uncharacterized protein n=1 Tax=Drepanopeziza brunnea f. sp. 'multigermtubi' TaxID=698441 RepID=UPI0023A31ADF|nr:hypothetical protein L3040_002811 [Drepanopeziza brunnea f. sp. 'multigermtubi']